MVVVEKFKVMLDAGHGYNTPGKRSPDDMREWEFNHAVALLARELLSLYENVEVQFSHDPTGKTDIPLDKRSEFANRWGADVFTSIHANAFGAGGYNDVNGIETFVYETKPPNSLALATKIQRNLVKLTGRDNRGVKSANFAVLRETKMDAVLVECGFMTNKEELALLKSADYKKQCAKAIVDGLAEQYKLKLKPAAAPPVIQPTAKAKGYTVQVGFFSNRANAENLVKTLEAKGFDAFIKDV